MKHKRLKLKRKIVQKLYGLGIIAVGAACALLDGGIAATLFFGTMGLLVLLAKDNVID